LTVNLVSAAWLLEIECVRVGNLVTVRGTSMESGARGRGTTEVPGRRWRELAGIERNTRRALTHRLSQHGQTARIDLYTKT
jgi:hypothetical protein